MSQKIKDGIVIDSTVYMTDEKNKGFPISIRLIQLFVIIVGCFSVFRIFIDTFQLPISPTVLLLLIITASVVFQFLFIYQSHDLIKLVVIGLTYLLVIFKYFKQLQNGFFLLENAIIDRAGNYYNFAVYKYKAIYLTATEDMTLILILIIIPVVALLSAAMFRNRMISLCYIILLLPVASSFLVGVIPSELYLLTYIMSMLYLSRAYSTGHKHAFKGQKSIIYRVNSRSAAILCFITLVIFFSMKLFISDEDYEGISSIEKAKTNIQNFMFSFSLEDVSEKFSNMNLPKVTNKKSGNGGLNSGELGKVDRIQYSNTEHLTISVPMGSLTNGMFLKGYVGSEYTGDSWESHPKAVKDSYKEIQKQFQDTNYKPANGSTLFLQNISLLKSMEDSTNLSGEELDLFKYALFKGKISIQYKAADKNHIYAPYHTDYEAEGTAKYRWDLYAEPIKKKSSYEFDYYYNVLMDDDFINLLQPNDQRLLEYSEDEKLYREFVYDTYTKLPEEGLERLKEDFSRQKLGSQVDNIGNAISYIKNYLHSNTQYTLAPGKLPKGKDFVEYFLYENKVGYCTHYASAGALMLRAMGYPARYAEGYSVGPSDVLFDEPMEEKLVTQYTDQQIIEDYEKRVEISVRDYNAHAWVEIYIDGCGWFPVEFTPGADVEDTNGVIENMAGISEDIKEQNELEITPTETPEEPTIAPEEEKKEETVAQPEKDISGEDKTEAGGKAAGRTDYFKLLLVLAGVAVILLPIGFYSYLYFKRRSDKNTDNNSKKALLIYEEIEKLLVLSRALPRRHRCLEDYIEYVLEHCPYVKEETFLPCMEAVKKARFGRDIISDQEYKAVEKFFHILSYDIYHNTSAIKKVYLKLITSV